MSDPGADLWSADRYAANAAFVPALGSAVLALLAPQAGETILDLGCGDGVLTGAIAEAGATVIGVDGSADMVAAARARGLDAMVMDAERLTFAARFDAVFSNAALHWMLDADAVLAGVARALKPGGRFVGEMGGHGNVAAIAAALHTALRERGYAVPAVWFFPTAEHYADLLRRHGFTVHSALLIPRPTPLPTGLSGWLATFASLFLRDVRRDEHEALLAQVEHLAARALRDDAGRWTGDYVRLRFSAQL